MKTYAGALRLLAMMMLVLLTGRAVLAQSSASVRSQGCRATGSVPVILVNLPVTVSAGVTITVPICAAVGPNLTLNTTTTPPQLEAVIPPPVLTTPRQVLQKVALTTMSALPVGSTADVSLIYTPAPNTVIVAVLRSSRVGGDVTEIVQPVTIGDTKLLKIDLPDYRPFVAADQLTVLYWTVDPVVVP